MALVWRDSDVGLALTEIQLYTSITSISFGIKTDSIQILGFLLLICRLKTL
jgi:hypothetical protein